MVMLSRLKDGRRIVALAIILAVLLLAWMFRFEPLPGKSHRNRFTGVRCYEWQECWFCNFGDCNGRR
jgi:hypothetical protein